MMADQKDSRSKAGPPGGGLDEIAAAARGARTRGLPPVHLWNPPFCGDIGLKIDRDGTWRYRGSPIGRPALVRLFSTILRKDPDSHVLVTPVEKISVDVEDAPFLAVDMAVEGAGAARTIRLRTNVDDWLAIDAEHPLRFEPGPSGGVKPYGRVRGDLWALATRSLTLDLVDLGEVRDVDGCARFGVASGGHFFVIADADAREAFA